VGEPHDHQSLPENLSSKNPLSAATTVNKASSLVSWGLVDHLALAQLHPSNLFIINTTELRLEIRFMGLEDDLLGR
jgi:hypothetical protein